MPEDLLTDTEIIRYALHRYALWAEDKAETWPDGSKSWAQWVSHAQRANQLLAQLEATDG